MATISEILLSGSTNGKAITVSGADTSAAVTVHTAVAGTSDHDKCWIYAVNTGSAAVLVTLEWGETDADGHIEVTIDGEAGAVLVTPGFCLQNGLIVKAFAATADVISLHGFVHRVTA